MLLDSGIEGAEESLSATLLTSAESARAGFGKLVEDPGIVGEQLSGALWWVSVPSETQQIERFMFEEGA
jgi:hypothetical protein